MLQITNLSAIRDERVLFESLSFTLNAGELVQIEGRNGAGKTTLLRIIAGLGDRDEGEVVWNGQNTHRYRDEFHQALLFLGHQTGVKRELSGYENLAFYLQVRGQTVDKESIYQTLTQVGLAGREDIPVAQLSAGQQRRVALARLWLSNHPLWILDEPLTAIDKQGVQVLERLFESHANNGGIVMLTTHQDMFAHNPKLRKIRLGDK
jgi:heme exporter protein A